ncbi:helix-turn-helix domain-containing protein [Mesorhizobium escarrei]|uniref:DNA-binding domain-containing protein, AraC-type n=1 Tax=Mesorhizobium escarrei TaxID=666018 RepID=A0ABN8KIR4_9HYPH|nr:helix-turn-helix domain-containing protein [Mesorhizobium escarrei]CAH2409122.1 DNA-binding domain-containing protein, AraC-type [Mesorhizobium escarrei]
MTAHAIPTYALYGEVAADPGADWLHCETIQSRSSLHGYLIEPHRHETLFQILHLESGRAEFISDGQQRTLTGPCVIVLPPLIVHGYTFSPDVEGSVLTLFDNRLGDILGAVPEAMDSFRAPRIVPLDAQDQADAIAADIAALAREFEGHAPGRLAVIEARLALILVTLHRQRLPHDRSDASTAEKAMRHLQRFRDLVGQDYRRHLPIEAYAQRLGLTAAHLNRLCRQHLGSSALDVIHQRLVLEAKRHLTFTTLSAKQVALTLSFDDPAYFARFFRQRTGMTPLQYRALQRRRGSPESRP